MAKVVGPLMSVAASGKFAGSMVYSTWKGRPYVRQLVTPANPKSEKQTGIRSCMKFLARWWATLSAPEQSSWDTLAAAKSISAFNAYVAENLTRWQNGNTPIADADATGGTPSGVTVSNATMTVTPDIRSATVVLENGGLGSTDIAIIYRSQEDGFTPSWANAIAILDAPSGVATLVDSPLVAGAYFYRAQFSLRGGKKGTISAQSIAIEVL